MRSTIAGEIRNSKFSAARRRRSRSGKCSGPNFAASASSEWIEFFLRTSCQVSITLPALLRVGDRCTELQVDDLVVAWGIEIRNHGGLPVAARGVEGPGARVVGASRGFHDDHPRASRQAALHLVHEPRADTRAL